MKWLSEQKLSYSGLCLITVQSESSLLLYPHLTYTSFLATYATASGLAHAQKRKTLVLNG
jgi:hypothetical protein